MNIQWQVVPFVGMNELKFGMARAQVRAMLPSSFKSFRKGPAAFNDTDSYEELGFHLYYDRNDNLEFIEAFSPCDIRFEGMRFLGRTLADVMADAKERNLVTRLNEKNIFCDFDEQGIALYIGNDEGDDVVEGTSIYKKGYYEDQSQP